MKLRRIAMMAVLFLIGSVNVYAADKDRVISEIAVVGSILEAGYAPADWKESLFNWNLKDEVAKAQNAVRASSTSGTREYQKIVASLLRSTRDYHVGFSFNRTEAAQLPFTVKSAEGKYIIVNIDRTQLSWSYPMSLGDELVSIDGKPTDDIVQDLIGGIGKGTKETDQTLAEMAITNREASKALDVPQGRVFITLKDAKTQKLKSFQIHWLYRPELIRYQDEMLGLVTPPLLSMNAPKNALKAGSIKGISRRISLSEERMIELVQRLKTVLMVKGSFALAPEMEGLNAIGNLKRLEAPPNPYVLGSRNSFLPSFGEKLWEVGPSDPKLAHNFQAYIYKHNGKRIGYVRIPHYMGSSDLFKGFSYIIQKFQGETDGLVIDQLNNPGGSVFYLYALVSLLTDQPIRTPQHRIQITTQEILTAQKLLQFLPQVRNDRTARKLLGSDWDGYPMTYQTLQFVIDYFRFLVKEWNAGKSLTDPVYLYGVDLINPSPKVTYDKPILVLVNELDFSGGDFFPAILQDNNRARIMGVRTAGAGGFVLQEAYPNSIGLGRFTYTGSLAMRPTGDAIENLGVVPDVFKEFTLNDLRNNYVDYIGAANAEIDLMTGPAPAPAPAPEGK